VRGFGVAAALTFCGGVVFSGGRAAGRRRRRYARIRSDTLGAARDRASMRSYLLMSEEECQP